MMGWCIRCRSKFNVPTPCTSTLIASPSRRKLLASVRPDAPRSMSCDRTTDQVPRSCPAAAVSDCVSIEYWPLAARSIRSTALPRCPWTRATHVPIIAAGWLASPPRWGVLRPLF